MSKRNYRNLTEQDYARIDELWRTYRALKKLRDHSLPPTAKGAWIYEAASIQMAMVADELETIYQETWDPDAEME